MDSSTRTRQILVFLAGMVVAGLIFAGGRASAGVSFSDTPPWIQPHASWLAFQGIAGGYDDGTFRPDDNITRGQAAFWFGNYNDAITREGGFGSFTNATQHFATAYCGAGRRPVTGGGTTTATGMVIADSYPVNNPSLGDGWRVLWRTVDGSTQSGTSSVSAVCMPNPVPGSP